MDNSIGGNVVIRHANDNDFEWLVDLMERAFKPFCNASQRAHVKAILDNRLIGNSRYVGNFVNQQYILIAEVDGKNAGMVQFAEEKNSVIRIGLLIITEYFRSHGVATGLLAYVEEHAAKKNVRQLYYNLPNICVDTLGFLQSKGFNLTGVAENHPVKGASEYLLYKQLITDTNADDMQKVSIVPFDITKHGMQAMNLITDEMRDDFHGIDLEWIDNLYAGRLQTDTDSVNHVIFVAEIGGEVTGAVGATLSKGCPIMLMPLVALDEASFEALIVDIQGILVSYSHKLYTHIAPNAYQAICLQRHGWKLEATLPGRYSAGSLVQQWAYHVHTSSVTRTMSIGNAYFKDIMAGEKTLEVRVGYADIKQHRIGELIQFETTKSTGLAVIKDVRIHASLAAVVATEPWQKILPSAVSGDAALRELRELMPNSGNAIDFYVFEIEVVKP